MAHCDLSVIISTYNRASVLGATLEALVRQSAGSVRYELIVVDNNSSDDTGQVITSFVRRCPTLVRHRFEPRQGVSHGRNAGLALATAPLVAFTDDDVRPAHDWVQRAVTIAAAHPHIAAFGGRVLPRWPRVPPRWLDERHWSPPAIADFGPLPLLVNATTPRCLIAANLVVRRAVFDAVGGFSPDFPRAQDHEWQLRFWRAGFDALYHPALSVRADIDARRLTRRYHWRWHARHGALCARMQLREQIAPTGELRARPIDGPCLFGAPRFLYGQLVGAGAAAVRAALRDPAGPEAFYRALAVRHLVEYIASARRRVSPVTTGSRPSSASEGLRCGASPPGGPVFRESRSAIPVE